MHRDLTEAEQIMLRHLIDNAGIGMVLATIADHCGRNVEDLASGNANLAKRWGKVADALDDCISHTVGL